jgi:hypothetical protein
MTLPDFLKQSQGTPVVWGQAGAVLMGLTVTHNMSLDALANAAGRNGVFADLGADFEQAYAVYVLAETGTAPTAGNVIEVFLAPSHATSIFPGKATGADAAYSSTPSVATNKLQIGGMPFILVATADANTQLVQFAGIYYPPSRYVAPVYINLLGQALRDEATASDNTSGIILVPLLTEQTDT